MVGVKKSEIEIVQRSKNKRIEQDQNINDEKDQVHSELMGLVNKLKAMKITKKDFIDVCKQAWTSHKASKQTKPTAYNRFVSAKFASVKANNPSASHKERMVMLGAMWKDYKQQVEKIGEEVEMVVDDQNPVEAGKKRVRN